LASLQAKCDRYESPSPIRAKEFAMKKSEFAEKSARQA